jgi:hypothetical protein
MGRLRETYMDLTTLFYLIVGKLTICVVGRFAYEAAVAYGAVAMVLIGLGLSAAARADGGVRRLRRRM